MTFTEISQLKAILRMEYINIPGLDIKASGLGLGCLQLGGHGWGNISEKEMTNTVHEAINQGITVFDTAPIYGLGHSEEMLGKILGNRRKDVIIATKTGLRWRKNGDFEKYPDASAENISREIDISLHRLKTDYIDIYQLHWPDPETPLEETLSTMNRLKESGKIRVIGLCNISQVNQCPHTPLLILSYDLNFPKGEREIAKLAHL